MRERERFSKKKWGLINPPNPPTSLSSSACRATDDLAALGDSTRAGPLPRKLKERPCSATSSTRDRRTFPNLEAMATAGNPMIFLRKIVNLWNCCELVVLLLFSRAFSVFHAGQRSYFIRLEWTNSRSCAAGWLKRAVGSTCPRMGSNLKRLPAMAQCTAWDRCQTIGMSQRIRFMSATSAQAASFASHHFLVQHEAMQHWPGTRGKRFRMVAENSLVLGTLLSLKVRQIIALIPSRNREF